MERSVGPDEVDAVNGDIMLLTEDFDRLAKHVAELHVQLGHEGGSGFRFAEHREDELLDGLRNGDLIVLYKGDLSVLLEVEI
jgi:hypothetical protein